MADHATLKKEYEQVWRTFVEGVLRVHRQLENPTGSMNHLHGTLRALHDVPYREAHGLLREPRHGVSKNIGAVTGLFFEQTAVSIIVPAVRSSVPDVQVQRNACSGSTRTIARDPDLYLRHGDREVVFEIKASPKKRDLEHVRRTRERYCTTGAAYFLVGGYASVHRDVLNSLLDEGWATFVAGSARNQPIMARMPTLDDLVAKASIWLTDA